MPLTDDTLAHFGLAPGATSSTPRRVDDLYQTADFQAKEHAAARSRGGYCLVKGPSGVGKSMLAHAALEKLAKERASSCRASWRWTRARQRVLDHRPRRRHPPGAEDRDDDPDQRRARHARLREVVGPPPTATPWPCSTSRESHGVPDAILSSSAHQERAGRLARAAARGARGPGRLVGERHWALAQRHAARRPDNRESPAADRDRAAPRQRAAPLCAGARGRVGGDHRAASSRRSGPPRCVAARARTTWCPRAVEHLLSAR